MKSSSELAFFPGISGKGIIVLNRVYKRPQGNDCYSEHSNIAELVWSESDSSMTCMNKSGLTTNKIAALRSAATLVGGVTAHKRFGIPINQDIDSVSHITMQSKEARDLRASSIIIWEEATASH